MADHSTPTKTSKSAPAKDTTVRDVAIVVGVALAMYVSANITPISVDTVVSGEAPAVLLAWLTGKVNLTDAQSLLFSLQNTFAVAGILLFAGSFLLTLKINKIHHAEHEKYRPVDLEEVAAKEKFIQWQVVLDHVNSESPAEWKLAILEADNMLDEILEDQGYVGKTLADKLKAMSPTKMASYNEVWDAHKLRNEIAHGGAIDMELSKKAARDAVAQFGNAFKELGYL